MSTLRSGTVLERVWTVSHELPESAETVVFDAARSELLVLNATAGALWYVLDGRRDLSSAVTFLRESLAEPPPLELMLDELRPFVETMLERGALRIVTS